MPLPTPNLDDRDFESLLAEARERVRQLSPNWTDLSESDPGVVLLQLFAYLTEVLIYRLNRVPDKVYIQFLNLLGVRLQPSSAAMTTLRFSLEKPAAAAIVIPRGTRATVTRSGSGEPPVFTTAETVTIAAKGTVVEVRAYGCELVEGELAGSGTGLPGLSVAAARPPIIAPSGDDLDLLVGVEATASELRESVAAIRYGNRNYRVWREVENFSDVGADPYVYIADRMAGTIIFAPAIRLSSAAGQLGDTPQALAAIPAKDREIRLWYRRGGGPEGNVAAGTITTLRDPIAGAHLNVTNPAAATGGRAAEALENALVRGPQQLHSLQRAVTARDFELIALSSSRAVARAKAFTRAEIWSYAAPGTVEVLLVPYMAEEERGGGRVSAAALAALQTTEARAQVQDALNERRPLGTTVLVNWARYKTVGVRARIVVRRQEDQEAVKRRVTERLQQIINPLPTPLNPDGWPFGQALRASHIYDAALAEPGVRWVDRVRLLVDEVPNSAVLAITSDAAQPGAWYVGSAATLFRSLNDGEGWEPSGQFESAAGEVIETVRVHPERAGLVAVTTRLANDAGSNIHLSRNSGETWRKLVQTAFPVEDAVWTVRDGAPLLLLATRVGLFELGIGNGASPVQVQVDAADGDQGFYAVAIARDAGGVVSVGLAAQETGGVYLSSQGGRTRTFRQIGLRGEDIRVLGVQYDGPRAFLWAGAATAGGDDPGKGCFRWELRGAQDPPDGWRPFSQNWNGGSCRALDFIGPTVLAGSHRAGVLRLDTSKQTPSWAPSDVSCGLPLRDPGRFYPVSAVAAGPVGNRVLAGGAQGVYLSTDGGGHYASASSKEFSETVTLPATWLFVSGAHDISVVSENEANRT